MVVGDGLVLTAAGIIVGVAASFGLTRFLSGQLFGVRAIDPLTFCLVGVLFLVIALVASYFPARRAASVDPMVALREN